MISPPPSPIFTASRSNPGKLHAKDENPPHSPKHEVDQLSQFELKRRHMHPDMQPSKRAPLDPLSPSDLENRRTRSFQSTDSVSYHSLVTPSSLPDLRALLPEQPVSSGSCGMQHSGASTALVCSWPPPIPTPGTGRSSYSSLEQQVSDGGPLHSFDGKNSSRATFIESTSTWHPSDSSQTDPTTTMTNPTRTTGWKSESVLQPIRSRINSLPSVRRPPGELWRSDDGPTKAAQEPVETVHSLVYPTPPGLPPRRPELRRSSSVSDLLPHGSVSLSLALGSQPLRASEYTKAVPPIGAERSRVVSITSLKSHIQNPPVTKSDDPSRYLWRPSPLSPGLEPKWKDEVCSLNAPPPAKAQAASGYASMSREDLERLLRHAVRNKYAPKIISPLSPLRTTTPAFDLSTDPAYQLRMPSQSNLPSPRYSKCPPRRARTVCDGYQSFDWDTTCMHCQECKRDTVGKKLLAFRYRQQQTRQVQRNKLHTHPSRAATTSVVDDDRIALGGRIREVFAYEVDEEEKSLWEEVAAITGVGPLPFSRVGAPCAAATHRRSLDGGSDDGTYDDYLEIPEEGLLANESATLFRDVSVY